MATEHLVFLSVPGLRPGDIDKANTPTLYSWGNMGALAEIIPTFPCVTSCVQASMLTGTPPGVGFTRTPPRWLRAGETVRIEIEKIGVLENPVVAEASA